jgi:SSS family solute:Na+ symporter
MAVQRYLATRDAQSARKVLNTSLVANTLVFLLLAALGLALLAYFQTNPHLVPDGQTIYDNADQLFTRFIAVGLPPGFAGLVVAGLLAAAMSSLSAGINASCSVVIADFIDRFGLRRRPALPAEGGDAWLERCVSVVIGALMVVLSSYVGAVHGNLLEIAYKVVNLLSAPLFGLFCMAMFVPWATGFGTLVGAAAGLAVVVAINFWEEIMGTKGISFLWAMPLSFLVQMAVGMLASLLPVGRQRRPPD